MGKYMGNFQKVLVGVFLIFGLWSCNSPDNVVDYTNDLVIPDTEPGSTSGYNSDRNVYFGDLHVHTNCLLYTSPSPRD